MTHRTIKRSMAENAHRICKHPGCGLPVWRIGSWCQNHAHWVRIYGHPEGRHVAPKEYAQELQEVTELIKSHSNHPGIQAALVWLKEWLEAYPTADPKKALPGLDVMWRLHAKDVTPERILCEAAAIWLYSYRYGHKLPSDERLTAVLGQAISKLTPYRRLDTWDGSRRYERPSPSTLKAIGRRVRDTLGRLLVNIVDTIQSQAIAKQQLLVSMSSPFTVETLNPAYLMNLDGLCGSATGEAGRPEEPHE